MKKLLFIQLFLFLSVMVYSQSKLSLQTQYFLSLRGQQEQAEAKKFLQKHFNVVTVGEKEYINAYIYLLPDANLDELEGLGVEVGIKVSEIITARIPVDKLEDISRSASVKYIQIGTAVSPQMDKAREAAHINQVQTGEGLDMPYTGKGVVVGVIDGGFEYGHINFYNRDRTELRVKRVWDQKATGVGTPPAGFDYGREYKTKEEILAAASDNGGSHGCHVAGIAVGADAQDGNSYYGVAGDADIVLVSYSGMSGGDANFVCLSEAIKYIYDYADEVGKPCVINLSLGSHDGPHDGTSTFDVVADALQGEGKLLVGAIGNDGDKGYHVYKTFESAEDTPLKSAVVPTITSAIVDIWGEVGMEYLIQIGITNEEGNMLQVTDPVDPTKKEGDKQKITLNSSVGVSGELSVYTEVSPLNGKPHASAFANTNGVRPNRNICLIITPKSAGTVHAWCVDATADFNSRGIEGWSEPTASYSLAEIGGTGKRILTVGAYVTKNSYTLLGGTTKESGFNMYEIAPFSGNGPTVDGRLKPEISAPGSYIASSVPAAGYTIFSEVVKNVSWDGKIYRYGMMQGTSMASPVVTGIMAAWLEANSKLTPENVRTILKNTAIQDEYTGTIAENGSNVWGYGKIDAWNGIKQVLESGQSISWSEAAPKFMILPGRTGSPITRILFTQADKEVHILVCNVEGQTIYNNYIGTVDKAEEIEVPMSGQGIYLIKVTGENYSDSEKVVIR